VVSINTIIMTIDRIYEHLVRRGLTDSYRGLSRDWLGSAENYACSLGPDGIPSLRVLTFLFRRLWAEFHILFAAKVAFSILWGETAQ